MSQSGSPLALNELKRVFSYNGITLADPSPELTPERVRDIYSGTYFELATAEIEGPTFEGDSAVYKFTRAVRTKG